MERIAIVEDEKRYADQLQGYLHMYEAENDNKFEVRWFEDGEDLLEAYRGDFDIILMDIQMRFMDGMSAAEAIRKIDEEVIIIFITNMVQYAIRGYEVQALDFIQKPVSYTALTRKIDRALSGIRSKKKNYLTIPVTKGVQKLDIDSIYYIESQGHNLIFHTKHGNYASRCTFREIEPVLIPYGFFRVQRCYMVNLEHVEGIRQGCCLAAGTEITLSRNKKDKFMEAMSRFLWR